MMLPGVRLFPFLSFTLILRGSLMSGKNKVSAGFR